MEGEITANKEYTYLNEGNIIWLNLFIKWRFSPLDI